MASDGDSSRAGAALGFGRPCVKNDHLSLARKVFFQMTYHQLRPGQLEVGLPRYL